MLSNALMRLYVLLCILEFDVNAIYLRRQIRLHEVLKGSKVQNLYLS